MSEYYQNTRLIVKLFYTIYNRHKKLRLQFMSTAAQRRLLKDLQRIQKESGDDIIATPQKNNLLKWTATIEGADGTPWEGGLFQLKLDFSEKYPNKPPLIKFISQMFHPNIYNDGRICLDMLQNQWSPIYDIWSVLTAIRALLADPNTLSPANMVASDMFTKNKNMYQQKVREIVQKSLQNDKDEDEFLEESKRQKQSESPAQLLPQNCRQYKKESQHLSLGGREEMRLDYLGDLMIKHGKQVGVERNNFGGSESQQNDGNNSQEIQDSQQIIQNQDSDNFIQIQEDEEIEQNEEDVNEEEQGEQQEQQNQNNEHDSNEEEEEGQENGPNEEYFL